MTDRAPPLLRPLVGADYDRVIGLVDAWWGGRPMAAMLPRLFFDHFGDTSFVAEDAAGTLLGFLVGFVSPARPGVAYVHFVGVDPAARGAGVGRLLYDRFEAAVRERGCRTIACVTAPANAASIAFHRRLGFAPLPGNAAAAGVPYTVDYDGPGEDRVRFARTIG